MNTTTRYLLFDSSCSLCTGLARDIKRASQGALLGKSLYAADAQQLLKRARPNPIFEPTLVEVEGERVRAYSGLAMRLRLLTTLDPRRVLAITRVVQKAGVPLLGFNLPGSASGAERARPGDGNEDRPDTSILPPGLRVTADGAELGKPVPVNLLSTVNGEELELGSHEATSSWSFCPPPVPRAKRSPRPWASLWTRRRSKLF